MSRIYFFSPTLWISSRTKINAYLVKKNLTSEALQFSMRRLNFLLLNPTTSFSILKSLCYPIVKKLKLHNTAILFHLLTFLPSPDLNAHTSLQIPFEFFSYSYSSAVFVLTSYILPACFWTLNACSDFVLWVRKGMEQEYSLAFRLGDLPCSSIMLCTHSVQVYLIFLLSFPLAWPI